MVSEANWIISLVCIIAILGGCNGKIGDLALSQDSEPLAQKTDSNIDSENHVKNHNSILKPVDPDTCPQHCTCDIENSRFQSIECSLANFSQGKN